MPKRDHIIDRFDTMNNVSDPKDLGRDEAEYLEGLVSDIPGQLRTMGKEASQSQTLTGFQTLNAHGLFHTLVDRNRAGTEQETEWILSVNKDTGIVGVLEYASVGGAPSGGTWNGALSPTVDLGTTANAKGVFHSFDGAIRVCDGAFGANNAPKWYDYIKRTRFAGGGTFSDDEWYATSTLLTPPSVVHALDSGSAWGDAGAGNGEMIIILSMEFAGDDNYLWHKTFEVACSYVYDNNQESLLTISGDRIDNDAVAATLSSGYFGIYMKGDNAYQDANLNKRITHVKLYIREFGTDDWYLQSIFDINTGGELPNGKSVGGWVYDAVGYQSYNVDPFGGVYMPEPLMERTYFGDTGYLPTEKVIDIGNNGDGWKASAVLNRQVYLFGVKAKDENGVQREQGDLILVSEPNKPDIFLRKNALVSVTGDGDHLVYGLGLADRIFEFKRNSLRIDNVAQSAFIEGETVQEGVDDVDKAVVTDYGVVWVNPNGLFLHNGKQFVELFKKRIEGKLEPFIDLAWFNTEVYGSGCGIAYNRKQQQIIVSGYASGDEMIIYDLASGSVSYGVGTITLLSSNFVEDIAGNSLFLTDDGADVDLYKFDFDETAYSNPKYWGRNEDFGDKGVKKYIYDVKIEYRNSIAENLDNNVELYLDGVSNRLVGQMLASQNSFVYATYLMTGSVEFLECKHAQIRIGGYDYDGGVVAKVTKLRIGNIIINKRILPNAR